MAFSLNKIMLIGNLGKDSETRFTTADNFSVTNFTLATTYSFKNKSGEWTNETTWHNIVAFNLSDFMKENLKKGKKVYVEGRLVKRDYTDKDNVKRYVTEVRAERIIPLDSNADAVKENDVEASSTQEPDIADSAEADDLPF
ncbi:Single-stranded DNA-binding protein [Ignavibacterium album JCM 16511]|uniref:Single-stranded DNA-binding protein n=1 Tax=Ignavibacterium album (strain DSM 19864 / JCM 16511 / NBRC 101810 / Mat9-16) TaxID=945713 RepID=I0AJV0_IGNAJ|nr:single-stranded DNA-binding protein [Ignavibacterium album]AFH49257.1 Single-stranded DNA-binding protein [Ignavibacterium album JCM 16511]